MKTSDNATSQKHPTFDQFWEEHKALVFWASQRVAITFGGKPNDYWATYVEKFNRCLYYFDEEKGKFSTYFLKGMYETVVRDFFRYESERKAIWFAARNSTNESLKQAHLEYNTHEINNVLYRVPEDDKDHIIDVIGCFETVQECWNFFTKGLVKRQKYILEQRIREGLTYEKISEILKISKQRVCQIYNQAIDKIRERLTLVRKFTDLFQKRIDED